MVDGYVNKSIFDMKFNNILRENIKKNIGKTYNYSFRKIKVKQGNS